MPESAQRCVSVDICKSYLVIEEIHFLAKVLLKQSNLREDISFKIFGSSFSFESGGLEDFCSELITQESDVVDEVFRLSISLEFRLFCQLN